MNTKMRRAKGMIFAGVLTVAVSTLAVMGTQHALLGTDPSAQEHRSSEAPLTPLSTLAAVRLTTIPPASGMVYGTPLVSAEKALAIERSAAQLMPTSSEVAEVEGVPLVNRLVEDGEYATWDLILRLPDGSFLPVHEGGSNIPLLKEAHAYVELALNLGKTVVVRGKIDPLGFIALTKIDFGEGRIILTDRGEFREAEGIPAEPEAAPQDYRAFEIRKLFEDANLTGQAVEVRGIPVASKFSFEKGVGVWNLLIAADDLILLSYESGSNVDLMSRLAALGELAQQTKDTLTLRGHYDGEARILNLREIVMPDGRVFDTDLGDKPLQDAMEDQEVPEVVVIEKEKEAAPQESVRIVEREVPVYIEREVPVYYPVYRYDPYPFYAYWHRRHYRYYHPWYYHRPRSVFIFKYYFIFDDVAVVNFFWNDPDHIIIVNQNNVTVTQSPTYTTTSPFGLPPWYRTWHGRRTREEILLATLKRGEQLRENIAALRARARNEGRQEHDKKRRFLKAAAKADLPQKPNRISLTGNTHRGFTSSLRSDRPTQLQPASKLLPETARPKTLTLREPFQKRETESTRTWAKSERPENAGAKIRTFRLPSRLVPKSTGTGASASPSPTATTEQLREGARRRYESITRRSITEPKPSVVRSKPKLTVERSRPTIIPRSRTISTPQPAVQSLVPAFKMPSSRLESSVRTPSLRRDSFSRPKTRTIVRPAPQSSSAPPPERSTSTILGRGSRSRH